MKIVPDNAQHIGARKEQQDAFGFSDLGQATLTRRIGALSVVADGMGGMEQGQEMSRLACRTMIEAYTQKPAEETIPRALDQALHTANNTVLHRARQLGVHGETGTTLSAAVIHDDGLHWTSVGDSRIYLYRDGMLTQLTVDHGYARHLERKVAAGEISAQSAAEHPERHAITSFLGLDTLEEIDRTVRPFPLKPGDRVLLCTDGLHGSLSDEEIGEILRTRSSGAAQALVDAAMAKRRKNQDNVTATLFDYHPNGVQEQDGRRTVPVTTVFPRNGRSIRTPHVLGVALLLILVSGGVLGSRLWGSIRECRADPAKTFGSCFLASLPQRGATAQPPSETVTDDEAAATDEPEAAATEGEEEGEAGATRETSPGTNAAPPGAPRPERPAQPVPPPHENTPTPTPTPVPEVNLPGPSSAPGASPADSARQQSRRPGWIRPPSWWPFGSSRATQHAEQQGARQSLVTTSHPQAS